MALPHEVVDSQRDAYNRKDLEGFVACCSVEVTLVHADGSVLAEGCEQLRALYDEFFEDQPNVHATILNRIAVGSVVIDEELVAGALVEGEEAEMHTAVLYEVIDDLITYVQILA